MSLTCLLLGVAAKIEKLCDFHFVKQIQERIEVGGVISFN